MLEVKKQPLGVTLKEEAELQADTARQEVGELVVGAARRYFPDAVKHQDRRQLARGVGLGLAAGAVIGYIVGHR